MKSIAVTLAALAAAATLGACSQVPMPESYPLTTQKQMLSAHHWDVLAMNIAQRLSTQLPSDRPVLLYVAPVRPNTAFGQALHALVVTHLVGHGFGVATVPTPGALSVLIETQIEAPDPDIAEIIVSTSVMDGPMYRTRLRDIYYVSDENVAQYLPAPVTPDLSRRIEVVGR